MNTREFKERIAAIDEDLFSVVVVSDYNEEHPVEKIETCTADRRGVLRISIGDRIRS